MTIAVTKVETILPFSHPMHLAAHQFLVEEAYVLDRSSGGLRLALEHARVLIHQPSGGGEGQSSDIEIQAREIMRMRHQLEEMISKHSGKDLAQVKKIVEQI